jgi:beta-N-acetylhexosaminidase
MGVSLKEMVGQMIMVGFKEAEVNHDTPIIKAISDLSLGGVILYDIDLPCYLEAQRGRPDLTRFEAARICPKNITSPGQLKALTAKLQGSFRIPLLIAVDMEGGLVSRLEPAAGFPETPSPKSLGEKNDPEETFQVGSLVAQTLRQSGINLNLAPVVDLDLNPKGLIAKSGRSFGKDPELVYQHAKSFILAHRNEGILATLKHFPGKGSAGEDTHFQMADVTSLYREEELVPFSRLIGEGLADTVMTSHINHRGWDEKFPVTLSPKTLQGLLREKLGYQGVIISDDLLMGAIAKQFSLEEACVLAVQAGVDILLASNNNPEGYDPDLPWKMIAAVCRGIDQGRIPESIVEKAYERIKALKKRLR